MTAEAGLLLSAIAFVATHFLLSHPLRRRLIAAVGERPFLGIYSLVALLTFGAMLWFYRSIGREPQLWVSGDALWIAASLLMWFGTILFIGSFLKNPAFPASAGPVGSPIGVFRITRHPMMWSFALWALVHLALVATPKALVLDSAILVLALGGALGQDAKKRSLLGDRWSEWARNTSFLPFAKGLAVPGFAALIGGTIFFFAATWLHPLPAGFWRWIT